MSRLSDGTVPEIGMSVAATDNCPSCKWVYGMTLGEITELGLPPEGNEAVCRVRILEGPEDPHNAAGHEHAALLSTLRAYTPIEFDADEFMAMLEEGI